ncbi:MAG: HNH endonuclease [Proteobacteria bacterium]|nr:MAG: HNH endonuclease [Pseudomonadota bacterium]
MTNHELENRLESLVDQERKITREILQLILLAEDRRLYLERGFDSLVRWLVGRYKYSETAAVRRVNAARMLRAVPAATGKIESGELNLTTLAKAQTAIYAEERRTGAKMPAAQKAAVAEAIENKSLGSTERTLAELFPEATKKLEDSRVQDRGADEVRISITLKRDAYELILKVKAALGHAMPEADLAEITAHVYEEYWKRKNPQREVRLSTHRVEVDHIIPRAFGGSNDPENLRCLCRAHNAHRAEKTFGNNWRYRQDPDRQSRLQQSLPHSQRPPDPTHLPKSLLQAPLRQSKLQHSLPH